MTKEDCIEQLYRALVQRYRDKYGNFLNHENIQWNTSYQQWAFVSNALYNIGPRIDIQDIIDTAWKQFEVYKLMNE